MNFDQALEYLLQLGHETLSMKLGLRNTELLLEALGNPEQSYPSVQIAGTNGKGSTAVMLDSICRKARLKTGLYTSPHLISITERIRIDGVEISEERFAQLATTVRNTAERLLNDGTIEALPTFFEHVTAIALLAFREAEVEIAILETGLGGRLDSTTAAKAETVAITQIAMDHEEYLGNTIESIAAEKAAIIHPGVKVVVVADHQPSEALAVIKRRCEQNNVRAAISECAVRIDEVNDGYFCATFQTPIAVYKRVRLALAGEHQLDNAAVAIQLAETLPLDEKAICEGLQAARHDGRLEMVSTDPPILPLILLDGAHNMAAIRSLSAHLKRFGQKPLTIVFGAMRDKRADEMISILQEISDTLILTRAQNIRSADPEDLLNRNAPTGAGRIHLAPNSRDAVRTAIDLTSSNGLIVVTGSLYLVGEVRRQILDQKAGAENERRLS
jgi:dihydrofolate synthase / folylpolyglutamate synthase